MWPPEYPETPDMTPGMASNTASTHQKQPAPSVTVSKESEFIGTGVFDKVNEGKVTCQLNHRIQASCFILQREQNSLSSDKDLRNLGRQGATKRYRKKHVCIDNSGCEPSQTAETSPTRNPTSHPFSMLTRIEAGNRQTSEVPR